VIEALVLPAQRKLARQCATVSRRGEHRHGQSDC